MGATRTPAKTWGPFNGRQLTTIIVAIVIGVIATPTAVWAVDTFSNVAIQDPVTGVKAQVDNNRRLVISALPRPPATPWSLSIDVDPATSAQTPVAGPSITPINLTSLSIGYKTSGTADLFLFAWSVPSTATSCSTTTFLGTVYHLPGLASSAGVVTAGFPTPLQTLPPKSQKACLYAQTAGTAVLTVNFIGYTGT